MSGAGPRVSSRHFVQLLTLKVVVGDAEAMVTAEFEQPLPVLIHPSDAEVPEAGRPCLPVGPNASVDIAPHRIDPWLLRWRSVLA